MIEIRVYVFLKKIGTRIRVVQKIILTFDANAKPLNFTEKLKTASAKCRINNPGKHGHVVISAVLP